MLKMFLRSRLLHECGVAISARRGRESSKFESLLLHSVKFTTRSNITNITRLRHSTALSELQNVKLITFDVTNTLLTFRKPPFEIYKDFGEKYGINCDTEKLKSSFRLQWKAMNREQPHFGTDWEAWWTHFVIKTFKEANAQGTSEEILQKVASSLIEHFETIDCWKLKPGAKELISALEVAIQRDKTLNRKMLAVGIISNFDPRLYHLLKIFEMDNLFILSHEHQTSKPSQKIFNLALLSFQNNFPEEAIIQPSEAMHVGDNYELDYVGAKNAGWKSCLISPDFNIQDIPENGEKIIPMKNEVHKDLNSFLKFLSSEVLELMYSSQSIPSGVVTKYIMHEFKAAGKLTETKKSLELNYILMHISRW